LRKFRRGIRDFILRLNSDPAAREVIDGLNAALRTEHWEEIVFCGFGEPTTRLGTLLEIARWITSHVHTPIRVNTNGHASMLHPKLKVAQELKEAGVSALSVSLNAHKPVVYNDVCQPRLEDAFDSVLKFIEEARATGLTVEITAAAIPEVKISAVAKIASNLGVKFRARHHQPCVW
jgi:cyclic pyranopterin phosphate synthase